SGRSKIRHGRTAASASVPSSRIPTISCPHVQSGCHTPRHYVNPLSLLRESPPPDLVVLAITPGVWVAMRRRGRSSVGASSPKAPAMSQGEQERRRQF
uniref:Uncharacterized protein n=2 Tax=Aegilops tauschii subsp. strangulata TaxID=200361 RepID=A0A453G637_AEGTS